MADRRRHSVFLEARSNASTMNEDGAVGNSGVGDEDKTNNGNGFQNVNGSIMVPDGTGNYLSSMVVI